MNIGEKFKTARKEKGITLEEIQKNTKIRTKYLEAIEENNFNIIPGKVYAKAFIKEYARQLNLDAEELIKEYQNIVNVKKVKEIKEVNNKQNKNNGFKSKKIYKLILIFLIILCLFALSFYIYNLFAENNKERVINNNEVTKSTLNSTNSEEVDKSTINTSNKTEKSTINPSNNNEVEKTTIDSLNNNEIEKSTVNSINNQITQQINDNEFNQLVTLVASEKSWVRVAADGEEVFQGFISPESQKEFSAENELKIKIGNGSGITIHVDNKIFGPFGSTGEVINFTVKFKEEHIH